MERVFSDSARQELADMPRDMKSVFLMLLKKIHTRPPGKHLKYRIPCHAGKVTKQAGIIYEISEDRTYILHCFTSHKEYGHWYSSYK